MTASFFGKAEQATRQDMVFGNGLALQRVLDGAVFEFIKQHDGIAVVFD